MHAQCSRLHRRCASGATLSKPLPALVGRRRGTIAAASSPSSSAAATNNNSIRDFIAQEAPLKSFDGSYRERPLEPTMEAPYLVVGALPAAGGGERDDDDKSASRSLPPLAFLPAVPGSVSLHALDKDRLDAVIRSGGRVLLVVVEEGRPASVATPSLEQRRQGRGVGGGGSGGGGSYAVAGRVAGVLGGRARVVAERRAAVQGLDLERGVAQAAELSDRWVYMCRAAAVEGALGMGGGGGAGGAAAAGAAAASAAPSPAALPREVALAVEQARDAAREVLDDLRACRDLVAAMAEEGEGDEGGEGGGAGASEAEAELSALLDWCDQGHDDDNLTFAQLERLSYAPLAARQLAVLVESLQQQGGGGGGEAEAEAELAARRLAALSATDAGARLEDAAEWLSGARRRLAAVRALRRG